MEIPFLSKILEALLLASPQALSLDKMLSFFEEEEQPTHDELREALKLLQDESFERSYDLIEVANGFRLQVKSRYAPWVLRLTEEKPARYSRALLETLALVAYRQPITRGEIESIRGVAVSTHIIKTLQEHEWIRVVGHKECPGRPALYATSKQFLDHFNLKSLDELPALSEIEDLDKIAEKNADTTLETLLEAAVEAVVSEEDLEIEEAEADDL